MSVSIESVGTESVSTQRVSIERLSSKKRWSLRLIKTLWEYKFEIILWVWPILIVALVVLTNEIASLEQVDTPPQET